MVTKNTAVLSLLMLGALKVYGQSTTSFTFTPDSAPTPFGYVTEIWDTFDTSNGYWEIAGEIDHSPIEMALKTTMLADTESACTVSTFEIYFNAKHVSSEGDAAIIISAGDEYISILFDYDGGVYFSPDFKGGIGIYPACGSTVLPQIPNDSTDTADLFDESLDTNPDNEKNPVYDTFVNWRDLMAGGDRLNWTPFNYGGRVRKHNTGFHFKFEIIDANTMTVSFWTEDGKFSTSCDMNTVFSYIHGKDIHVDFSPDYQNSELWQIYDITVTSDCAASCYNSVLQCPPECSTNPCECDSDEIGSCMTGSCHVGVGCSACESGSFKKGFNYPCVDCQETFGSECTYCSDFVGCMQCSSGVRTYDNECGLFYCNTC